MCHLAESWKTPASYGKHPALCLKGTTALASLRRRGQGGTILISLQGSWMQGLVSFDFVHYLLEQTPSSDQVVPPPAANGINEGAPSQGLVRAWSIHIRNRDEINCSINGPAI